MEAVARALIEFVSSAKDDPYLFQLPTVGVLNAIRGRLDERAPEWREEVSAELPQGRHNIEIELHLPEGAVLCGTLFQRPSDVPDA